MSKEKPKKNTHRSHRAGHAPHSKEWNQRMILIALAMFVVSGLYVYSLATHSHAAAERFVTKYQAIDQSKFRKTH